jgi:protoporphyrinogen oxidase
VGYDSVLNPIPLSGLLELCEGVPADVSAAARRLRCPHLYYLDVALDTPARLDYHWVYVPEPRYPCYRVGCYSNFSEKMAPPGKASLYVELAERERPNLEKLLPQVGEALVEMGWCRSPSEIAFARLRRIDHAYVIFDRAYREALSAIEPFLDENGIVSRGRYGSWTYSSMEDALIAGREAAIELAERHA